MSENPYMIGAAIKARRGELGLTQAQVAEAASITELTVAQIENDRQANMRETTKVGLARALRWVPNAIDLLRQGVPGADLADHTWTPRSTATPAPEWVRLPGGAVLRLASVHRWDVEPNNQAPHRSDSVLMAYTLHSNHRSMFCVHEGTTEECTDLLLTIVGGNVLDPGDPS